MQFFRVFMKFNGIVWAVNNCASCFLRRLRTGLPCPPCLVSYLPLNAEVSSSTFKVPVVIA